MEVRIQSIHFDASERLQAFIQKKADKLEKFCDNIKKVEVSLKVVKPETAMNKEAGVRVLALNSEFYAEKISDTFEESIDVCMEALSKQLLKAKEKQRENFFYLFYKRDPDADTEEIDIDNQEICKRLFKEVVF